MEIQEVKEQLKEIFRTVINNDKWITIHPNGEDGKGRHLLLKDGETPKEAIDRVYKKEDKKVSDKDEKEERTFIDKKTGKEQSLKDLVEKGLTPVRYSSSLWENKPSYGIGDGKIEYKITEEEYKQALEHQKNKKSSDLQKAKKQSKDLTDYIKWQYNADIEPHITRRVGDKTLVEWDKLPRETQSALKRLDFDDKVNLEQYSSYEMSIDVKDKKIFENLEKHRQHISEQKQSDSKGEKKYNYTLTKREVEANKMFGGMADTGNYYTNGEFAIDKKYLNIKGQEPTKKEEIEKSLKNILKGDSTSRYTPVKDFEIGELKREYGKPIKVAKYSYYDEKYGYERNIYLNKKYNDLFKNFDLKFGGETEPVFAYKGNDIVGVVMPVNAREQSYSKTVDNEIEEELTENKNQLKLKIDNEKEYEMSLLEEIKKLITRIENNKEQDMDIENGKVDKRKLIDEVAGIMKSAGCDDEDIRTAIGKMEKIGYDKSEDDTADNCGGKKVKNEEKPEEVKNEEKEEPEKDKKEVEEVKEEIKEDVGNKCDNSKSSFDKINGIYNSIKQVAQERQFVSRQDKLDNAVEYFK